MDQSQLTAAAYPILAEFRAVWLDRRITLAEFSDVLHTVADRAVTMAATFNIDNPAKKQFVLDTVGEAFETLWILLPAPVRVFHPCAKRFAMDLAGGTVEFLVRKMKRQPYVAPLAANPEGGT